MTTSEPVIELVGVEKSFGKQKVLHGVDLTINRGETLVIVGGSGEGKSVVLKHMLGLLFADSGTVKAFGRDMAKLDHAGMSEVRKRYGTLFQGGALLDSMNVYDNVALPLRERTKFGEKEIKDIVQDRLLMMDLEGVDEKFPAQLSGGMKKRVGLARALALDPEVVFFDEPTTGLDVHKSHEIHKLFRRTKERLGYTSVIVSHDAPKIFKLADKVALLAGGRIAACLSPEDFQLSDNPHVRSFVETTMGPIYTSSREEVQ